MFAKFYDSHRLFKPFTVESEPNESERNFARRCRCIYYDLMNEYENKPHTYGNHVYMWESRLYESEV